MYNILHSNKKIFIIFKFDFFCIIFQKLDVPPIHSTRFFHQFPPHYDFYTIYAQSKYNEYCRVMKTKLPGRKSKKISSSSECPICHWNIWRRYLFNRYNRSFAVELQSNITITPSPMRLT